MVINVAEGMLSKREIESNFLRDFESSFLGDSESLFREKLGVLPKRKWELGGLY